MNQLRTTNFIRTKVAVYPNSFSDILTETRYGDVVMLEENIDDFESYSNYRKRTLGIIENYINVEKANDEAPYLASDIFEISNTDGEDCIEQMINASGGNYRRLIQLLDATMNESFISNSGNKKVNFEDAISAIKKHCQTILSSYSSIEKEYILNVSKVCKNRSTFRFNFPYNAPVLYKYMTRSQEFNVIKVIDAGVGRKGTTYAFDYTYCVLHDLPTHYIKKTERIDRTRSQISGEWITRTTSLNQELLAQTEIPDKLEGKITFTTADKARGFIRCENETIDYFFQSEHVIESDRSKNIFVGKTVKFCPGVIGDSKMAFQIEVI